MTDWEQRLNELRRRQAGNHGSMTGLLRALYEQGEMPVHIMIVIKQLLNEGDELDKQLQDHIFSH